MQLIKHNIINRTSFGESRIYSEFKTFFHYFSLNFVQIRLYIQVFYLIVNII